MASYNVNIMLRITNVPSENLFPSISMDYEDDEISSIRNIPFFR